MINVKVKLVKGGIMPTKAHDEDAAWDCYAKLDVYVGRYPTLVDLGFCLELPKGYHAEIVPRSSTGLNTDLRQPNSVGIIDSNYRGEVKAIYEAKMTLKAKSTSTEDGVFIGAQTVKIHRGDRIAQMLIVKDPEVRLVEVDELSDSNRGIGGFGSTGM